MLVLELTPLSCAITGLCGVWLKCHVIYAVPCLISITRGCNPLLDRIPSGTLTFLLSPHWKIFTRNICRRKFPFFIPLFKHVHGRMITFLLYFFEFAELHCAVLIKAIISACHPQGNRCRERTSWTGICMYKQPGEILASSKVFTLETLGSSVRPVKSQSNRTTYYARRLWISVIAGTVLASENGFHLLISSHQPDTESLKFRGELSSIWWKIV